MLNIVENKPSHCLSNRFYFVYSTIGVLTAVLLLLVVWTRLEMKLHSPAQVASGALLSALIVTGVFQLFGLIGAAV